MTKQTEGALATIFLKVKKNKNKQKKTIMKLLNNIHFIHIILAWNVGLVFLFNGTAKKNHRLLNRLTNQTCLQTVTKKRTGKYCKIAHHTSAGK